MSSLSIIVIAYNEEKFLPRLLDSLLAQSFSDFELIVVDSRSTDCTLEIADAYAGRFPHYRVVRLAAPRGPGFARNEGAAVATSERLLFLDADTTVDPDFLQSCLDDLAANGAHVATCLLRITEARGVSRLGAWFLNRMMILLHPFYASAFGACMFSTREVHLTLDGFKEWIGICEDCYYAKQARRRGYRFRILHRPFYSSDRRAQNEGSLHMTFKYLRIHAYRLLTGKEIPKDEIVYDYGVN